MNVHEVIRCTCLALRRRYELLGPVAVHDPLTSLMITAFDGRMGPPNHWTQAWLNVQRGWALTCAGKADEAKRAFQGAVLLSGRYDHPLTATAMMGLGNLARDAGQPGEALKYFISASVAAAVHEEIETVEDALIAASDVHLAGVPAEELRDLSLAANWATRKRLAHLNATVMTLAAENVTALRKTAAAGKLIGRAKAAVGRRGTLSASLAARAGFISSQIEYQQGKVGAAEKSFIGAIQDQRRVSPWLLQIGTVTKLYRERSREITTRSINTLFEKLLREPTAADWGFRPLDTLAFVLTPSRPAHEDWFDVALERDESRKALEIGETMRRRRFYSKLPLGGRVLSLRWCLEAPKEVLSEDALAARLDILARYPRYKELSDAARKLRDELEALPLDPNEEQTAEQKRVAKELSEVTEKQESILGELALRREACPFVFPPKMTPKDLQESLGEKQLALIYVSTWKGLYAFMLSSQDYVAWELPDVSQVRNETMAMLKHWGLTADNVAVTTETLRDPKWKEFGTKLLRSVIERGQHGFWNNYDEIVIVPDGIVWYVPFEGLPIQDGMDEGGEATKADPAPIPIGIDEDAEEEADDADADGDEVASEEAKEPAKEEPAKEEPAAGESPIAEQVAANEAAKAASEEPAYQPLINRIRMRYVPTAGLINAKRLPAARDSRTAIVLGKLFPRDGLEIAETQAEEIKKVTDGVVALPRKLAADSGLLRCTWGGLVVLDDVTDLKAGPLDWVPAQIDEGRPGGSLRRWMELPWGGPSRIILPGYHTLAESGLKTEGNGDEMFTTSMGLMATGARTVVLSRWRTGGLSCFDLVREFMQEEAEIDPSEAWQRSLQVMQEAEIDPHWEPRVNNARDKDPLYGDHPFFWAGYMLIGG